MYDLFVKFQLPDLHWSEPIRTVAILRPNERIPVHLDGELRALTADEVDILVSLGNYSVDWSLITVAGNFDPYRIVGSQFIGSCAIGLFASRGELPSGIYYSTIASSVIGSEARVYRCPLIRRTVLDRGTQCLNSRIEGPQNGDSSFGCGTTVTVGSESDGRTIALFPELDLDTVELVLDVGPRQQTIQPSYARYIAEYVREVRLDVSYVAPDSMISDARVEEVWIGPGTSVEGSQIERSTVLSSTSEQTRISAGCVVRDSIVQWGAEIDTGASLSRVLMMEHSRAEQNAAVSSSVVGPGSTLGRGEVTASFLGPLVAAHHQSLLIGAYWPSGRGNLGYGSNVGSNHTSRSPDQEVRPGEGTFFGLDCAVKFPFDLSESPYCVVATSTVVAPQAICMPFSLISNLPTNIEITGAQNLVVPGWMLRSNMYAILRAAIKFAKRDTSRRNKRDLDPFRKSIIELVRDAYERLRAVDDRDIYAPGEIPGAGSSVVRGADRLRALEVYSELLEFADLRDRVIDGSDEHVPKLENSIAQIVERARRSRARDWERGGAVYADYADLHPRFEDDPILNSARDALGVAGLPDRK